jgi:tRNA(Arg) A34 adenosine deaminase TadA
VLREAQAWLLAHPYQATLYSSLEPCLMYLGAALNAKVGTIVFATRDGDRQFTTVLESNAYLHYKATKTHICCEPCAQARRTARDLLARYWHQQGHSTKATTFEVSTPIAHWRTPAHETACDE